MENIINYKRDLIIKFIDKDMTELEFERFKTFVDNDPQFKEAVQFQLNLKEAGRRVKERENQELLKQPSKKEETKVIPFKRKVLEPNWTIWVKRIAIAASIILVVGFLYTYIKTEKPLELAVIPPSAIIRDNGLGFAIGEQEIQCLSQIVEDDESTFVQYFHNKKQLIIGLTEKRPDDSNKIKFGLDASDKLIIEYMGKKANTNIDFLQPDKDIPKTKIKFQ